MSKAYAMRNAGTNNGSSRQNNNGGTKKKDRFQEAYEQGTRIYEQNRSQLVQQTQQLQTQLQGIGNGPLTYQQARNVRTYYNNLQSLTTYGFDTSEQIQAIDGFARQNNKLLSTYKTEKDYNNGYLYPARYSGLSGSTNTTNQLNGLRRTIGALRQPGGDKARADALQAEYDWLEQHQYDYWSQDELDDRIKHVEGLLADANQAVYDSENYTQTSTGQTRKQNSGYMYDNPLGTEADHKEADAKEHVARYTAQINTLKAAKESNAYRDAMADWDEQDFKNMEALARFSGQKSDVQNAGNAAQLMTPGVSNPWLALQTAERASENDPEMERLTQYFRDKGYNDAQIGSLMDYFLRNQHARDRQQMMQELATFAKDHPVLASAISVPINLASGLGYADLALQNATAGTDAITGEKQRVDQYSALTSLSDASSAMRGAVSEDMGGFGKFLYNTGMSMADFLAAAPAGGGATELMLGGAAAMQATREAYARGASDGQALGMGAWAGASEAAFEHLSLGSLKAMKTSVTAARGTFKQILVDMAKQGFVEGSEETFTTISNTLGDAFIMGDKSALNTAIRDYMAQGLSEEEATRKAYTDWAMNTALDFAGGALSGGVLGGGNRVRMNWAQGVQGQAILDQGQELEVINTALAMPEGSEARVFAEHLTETKMKSGDYTATEIGQLAWAVEAQRAQTKSEDNPASDMPRTHPVVTTATDGSGATVMATQMSEVAEALVAAGDTHQEALAKTKIVEAVVAGDAALTGSQINKVGFNALTAQSTVDVIKQYTGVDITANGKTASAIRKSILAARDQQAERAAQIKAQGEAIRAARAAVDAAAAQNDADAAAKAAAMLDEAQAAASTGARAQVADSAAEGTGAPAETAAAPVGDTTAAATAVSETAAPAGDDTLHFSNGGSLTFKEFVDAYHDANPNKAASKAELARRFGELLKAQEANGGTLPAKELRKAVSGSKTKTKETSADKAQKGKKAKSDTMAKRGTTRETTEGKAESDLSGKARAELEASRNTRETEKGKTVKVAEGVEFAAREDGLQKLSDTQVWTGALVYRFMKNIGIKKVVYDAAYVGADANALIEAETGTIYINPEAKGMDNRGTILWALGHEISHPATDGSKSNNALAEKILSTFEKVAKLGALKEGELQSQVVARTTTVNKTLARYKAFYEAHGNTEMAGKVDEHFASQEVAGDWIGWAFQSREIMERIGRVDPSTLNLMQRAVLRLQETVTKLQRAQARKQYGTGIGILNADADSAAEAEKIIRGLADDVNSALKKSELNQSFKPRSKAKAKSKAKAEPKTEAKTETAPAEEAAEAPAEASPETNKETPVEKERFSVSEPVEYTKNLVALHNFSAMSMRRILRDGGMPTASIAVVKHDMAHTAFGDWTIVLPRESVDPQANPNNKMWGGDAYTPMVNHLETPHAVDEDATDAIIDELVDKTGDPYYNRILSEVVLTMRRGGVNKAISDYVQNLGLDPDLRDVFNADQSEDVKAARSDPELLGATDEALRYYWPGNPVAEDMLADAAEAVDDALGTDFLEQVENGDDTAFVDFCNRVNETPAAVANWMHERFDGAVSEAPAHVMNVDRYTGEVLEEQPYTLENVVRMMYDYFPHQSFDTDPSDLQDPDLNGWQSAAVPKINSIDEAHELSDRLRKDRVEHRDKLTKLRDQLISVTKNILPFARHMSFQNVAELLSSTASAKSTSEIKNAFFKEGAILPENLAEKVLEVNQAFADLPQQYFEAKAERVIDLDEMKKGLIVAPKDAPKDLLDQVRQVFPNVVTYDTQRPETRLDAVNSPVGQNLRFQINPDFASDIDEWDQNGRKAHTIFDLGTTGEVLQSLGATEGDIRLDSEKIETILKEHPEMTLDDIKALGEIVNNPVLVLKSRNVNRSAPNTRVVMIGDHKASNGKYVLAILDLSPNNSNLRVAGMQKLSSSYTKLDTSSTPDAFRQLLKMSYVMYYDPKRAAKVLSAAGLRLRSDAGSASDKKAARELPLTGLQSRPGHYSQSGFVGSVAYQRDFVKPSEYIVKMYGARPSDVFEDLPKQRHSVTRDQFENDEDFRAFYRDLFGGLGLTERAHADARVDNTPPDREVSLVRSNTFDHLFTATEKRMDELKEGEFEYDRVTEVQSMSAARERLDTDYEGERDYLENHSFTNGTDLDTAMGILSVELAEARESGDYTKAVDWAHVIRANGTAAGQLVQAFAKYSRTPEGVLINAIETLEESDLDPEQQDEIIERIFEFSRTLQDIERGDEEGRGDLIDLILEQAEMRNTKVSKTTLKNLRGGKVTWLYDLALNQMDQIARDFIKPSFAKGLATFQTISHLFNIRTTNRNLGSNTLFSPIAAIGNNLAMIPDAIASVFTGQRYVGFDRWIFSKATWKGMREGGAKAWVEVALDVQPEPTQRDKYGTARRTWKMTGGRAARVGSTIEKMMGYELNWTDEFHKGGIRAEIMQSLEPMVRNGVITTEMAEQWAEQEALYRAFQDDTYMGNLLAILKNGMNTIGIGHTGRKIGNLEIKEFGLGDLVQKYTQVPGALFTRAVEFSPVGYAKCLYLMAQMSSAAKESKKANAKYETLQARADESSGKDALVSRAFRAKTAAETAQVQAATAQRMFALAVGRATTGTGLLALFATLALKGVLRRADDEDDPNVKAQNLSEGITGTQLNTSALARMIRGDSAEYQTGDHLVSVDWIEPINGLMTMGALIAKDTDGDQSFADKVKSYGLNSLDGLYLAFSDLPTMQTLQTIRDTVNYYDEEDSPTGSLPLDIAIEVGRGSLTGFIPSPVRQIAQATDPVQRDAYTSNSVMQQTWDQIRNSIPGLRQQLPVKKDNLGNDRKQESGLLGVLNATFLPGNIRTYQQSEYSKEMYEVYKATGDSSFYPGKSAPYSISMSIDGEQTQYKLDADDRVRYQQTRGSTMYALIRDMHDDPVWKAATPEERAEMLSMAKNLATYAANQEVARSHGATYTNNEYEKTNGALDVGYTVASWQNIRSAMSGVEGVDEDGDGKADDGTKKAAALQVLVDLDLTDEQKVYWYRGSSYAEETDKVGEAMAAGISANDWFSAKIALSNAHGTDNNGDGKTDSGSVQADVIRILMSMNLTPEQRRLLFLQMYPQSTKKANGTNWGD